MKQGHAEYVGMQGDLHGTPAVRVYHVVSGPDLPPPIPYGHILSAAPDMLAALERTIPLLIRLGDFIGNGVVDPSRPDSLGERCDLIGDIRTIIRQARGDA